MSKKSPMVLLALAIIGVCFSIYYLALGFGFVAYDDPVYLLTNEGVRNFNLKQIFSPLAGAYSPLTFLSYAIEHSIVQLHPFLYHLTNLLLHVCNSLLAVYFTFKISKGNFLVAAFVGLLFAAHPLHVESVVWITERKDVLTTFFYLFSLIFYVRYVDEKRSKHYAIALLLFICSVLSKSTSMSLPALMILIDWFYRRPFSKKVLIEKIPFILISIGITLFQMKLLDTKVSTGTQALVSFGDAVNSYAFYIFKTLVPIGLAVYYERGVVVVSATEYLTAAVVVITCGIFFWINQKYRRDILFGFSFFIISLFPVSQIIPFGTGFIYADRYMYLPSVGLFFVFGLILTRYVPARVMIGLIVISTVGYGYLSYQRTKVWSSSQALWQNVVDQYPQSSVASNNLGIDFYQRGQINEALEFFRKAVLANPRYLEAQNNLGATLTATQDVDGAFRAFQDALKIKPDDPGAHYGIGNLYAMVGRRQDAKSEYLIALESDPEHLSANLNLGLTYLQEGLAENAAIQFRKVLTIDPNNKKAQDAMVLMQKKAQ